MSLFLPSNTFAVPSIQKSLAYPLLSLPTCIVAISTSESPLRIFHSFMNIYHVLLECCRHADNLFEMTFHDHRDRGSFWCSIRLVFGSCFIYRKGYGCLERYKQSRLISTIRTGCNYQ